MRKDFDAEERQEVLTNLCTIFGAKAYDAEYFVTRNIDDYKTSEIKAILPKEYLKL